MSTSKQDVFSPQFILNQQETSVLDLRGTKSPQTKERSENINLAQVKDEGNGSELKQIIKVEDHIVLKLEMDTSAGTDSGSHGIKEPIVLQFLEGQSESRPIVKIEVEDISQDDDQDLPKKESDIMATFSRITEIKDKPVELELQQMNKDIYEYREMVKMGAESISQDDKQDILKQETDATMVTVPGTVEIKEEPGEQDTQQVKEEEDGPEPLQMVKKEADDLIQDVLKQETDALNPTASADEKYHQKPELDGNQIIFQNFTEAENHQEIEAHIASGSSRDEQQQRMSQKTIGQSDDVEKTMKDKGMSNNQERNPCKVCGKIFKHLGYLKAHLQIHEKPFSCLTCGKSFSRKNVLTRHTRSHISEKPFKCSVCGKGFIESFPLSVHMRRHTGEKLFQCTDCKKNFFSKSELNKHVETHKGNFPFLCIYCGKCLKRKANLELHLRTHTGEKPFSCETCGKSFADKMKLNRHMTIHLDEKPFKCSVCGKSYAENHYLVAHTRSHTGEKPFECVKCGKAFSTKGFLNAHKKRLHPDFIRARAQNMFSPGVSIISPALVISQPVIMKIV